MSGFFGIYRRDGAVVERRDLSCMGSMLAHRGDRSELHIDGAIGLGARTLITTPEQQGELNPLKAGTIVLAADARIDNRDELFNALGYGGADRKQLGDVALIAHAFRKWGEDCVEHLVGDFAFAIWNEADQSLYCARDRMGVRPLYYYVSDSLFAFASEIKSLFCLHDVPRDIDDMRVASHLL
ncbi:MAG: asparagine synthetase B, partial [bacterium]|nr:asparagine synthetase B [Candidatus Kapabacteria bacterium]